jgi:hypothetical protein
MNCQDFKAWLDNKDLYDERVCADAEIHMAGCEQCNNLYTLDALIDARVKDCLKPAEVPQGLLSRIETDIMAKKKDLDAPFAFWKKFVPLFAAAAIVFMIVINPFSAKIKNLNQMQAYALENHLAVDKAMEFKTADVEDASKWFKNRLGYNVTLPNLHRRGLNFIGGRECVLGKKKAAYLLCEKQGKKASLFIVDADALNFPLDEAKNYFVTDQGYEIKVWKEGNMAYALVI